MFLIFIIIFVISLILAIRSMKDFGVPNEIKKIILNKKTKGRILILKNKTIHIKS